MARVTVEDCLEHVDNRFQLVLIASKRARQLLQGAAPYVEQENDKATVMALREIADGHITEDVLNDYAQKVMLQEDEATDEAESSDAEAITPTSEAGEEPKA